MSVCALGYASRKKGQGSNYQRLELRSHKRSRYFGAAKVEGVRGEEFLRT